MKEGELKAKDEVIEKLTSKIEELTAKNIELEMQLLSIQYQSAQEMERSEVVLDEKVDKHVI